LSEREGLPSKREVGLGGLGVRGWELGTDGTTFENTREPASGASFGRGREGLLYHFHGYGAEAVGVKEMPSHSGKEKFWGFVFWGGGFGFQKKALGVQMFAGEREGRNVVGGGVVERIASRPQKSAFRDGWVA